MEHEALSANFNSHSIYKIAHFTVFIQLSTQITSHDMYTITHSNTTLGLRKKWRLIQIFKFKDILGYDIK